jgi:maleylacetate reductase
MSSAPEVLSEEPRVLLGDGALSTLSAELSRLDRDRALVVCTPGRTRDAELVTAILGPRAVGIFAEAAQHVPAPVATRARERCDELTADVVVALGGGTAIGVAKAIAAARPVLVIAIPTTYSGSEMTDIYGVTDEHEKRTSRASRVRPSLVLYDPALTRYLPRAVTVTSGFNAIAHCSEALWVLPEHAPSRAAARTGLEWLCAALPAVVAAPDDTRARADAMRGAYWAGRALEGGVALHHKLCHLLGGAFGLPHAETHTALLPHVARYNTAAAPDAMQVISGVLGAAPAPQALFDLARRLGGPTALAPFGFSPEAVGPAAARVERIDFSSNPRPLDIPAMTQLLEDARVGRRPA